MSTCNEGEGDMSLDISPEDTRSMTLSYESTEATEEPSFSDNFEVFDVDQKDVSLQANSRRVIQQETEQYPRQTNEIDLNHTPELHVPSTLDSQIERTPVQEHSDHTSHPSWVNQSNIHAYKKSMLKLHQSLLSDMEAPQVCNYLISDLLMTLDKEEEITMVNTTSQEKNKRLLRWVDKGDLRVMNGFLHAVQQTTFHLFEIIQREFHSTSECEYEIRQSNGNNCQVGKLQAKVDFDFEQKGKNNDLIRQKLEQFIVEKYHSEEELLLFQNNLVWLGATLDRVTSGCICLHLSFMSTYNLTKFYMSYLDGTFKALVNTYILTNDDKKKFGVETVQFDVKIDTELYLKAIRQLSEGASAQISVTSSQMDNKSTQTEEKTAGISSLPKDRSSMCSYLFTGKRKRSCKCHQTCKKKIKATPLVAGKKKIGKMKRCSRSLGSSSPLDTPGSNRPRTLAITSGYYTAPPRLEQPKFEDHGKLDSAQRYMDIANVSRRKGSLDSDIITPSDDVL